MEQTACQHKVTGLVVIACLSPPSQVRPEVCLEAIVAFIIDIQKIHDGRIKITAAEGALYEMPLMFVADAGM